MFFINFAGFPPTTVLLGTSLHTTDPAAITALSPILTPRSIIALPPIHTFFPIITGLPEQVGVFLSSGLREWQAV